MLLSICIATINRAHYISETLDSILPQVHENVEVVIVDGNSSDNTEALLSNYCSRYPCITYIRENTNSGVDCDFDKCLLYAAGEYCWLMTDDDLLKPYAISSVLKAITSKPDLVVVDTEVRNIDFSRVLEPSRMHLAEDQYFAEVNDDFLACTGDHLSFIGAVIIRRALWLERDRKSYYGSLFIHVGVILQLPALKGLKVLKQPLIDIRYGNAMWTPRSFEIWMFLWPGLIWGFSSFTDEAKSTVCKKQPWKHTFELLKHRAKGSYTYQEYQNFLKPIAYGKYGFNALLIALIPAKIINTLAVIYVVAHNRQSRIGLSDLLQSPAASWISRYVARKFPLSELEP